MHTNNYENYRVEIHGASDDLIEVTSLNYGPHHAYEFVTKICDYGRDASVILVFYPILLVEIKYNEGGIWYISSMHSNIFVNITRIPANEEKGEYSDLLILDGWEEVVLRDVLEFRDFNALPESIAHTEPFFNFTQPLDPFVTKQRIDRFRQIGQRLQHRAMA